MGVLDIITQMSRACLDLPCMVRNCDRGGDMRLLPLKRSDL